MKKIILLIALFTQSIIFSQGSFHIVGTGNLQSSTTAYPSIYGNWFRGVKHQMLIKASELQAAGMSAGNITGLGFDVVVPSGGTISNFEIELKSTTQVSLSAWSNNNLQTCFGPTTVNEITGWNQHNFHTPFYWDGISNIVVQTCFYSSGNSQNAIMNMSNYGYNTLIYRRNQNSSPCQNNWINGVETQRPNMRFEWVDPSSPPISNFSLNTTSSCSGTVSFTDLTSNSPSSWSWDFGDGNTSTDQNPTHTYTSSGTYTVTLVASNAFGSDTTILSNIVTVNIGSQNPSPASCTPNSQNGFAGWGITSFNFGNISRNSLDATEGYADFTCDIDTFYIGQFYQLTAIHSNSNFQNFAAWIDYNNDGVFDNTTELIAETIQADTTNVSIQIPGTSITNTPLRLRIMADFFLSGSLDPCLDPTYGQAEDYTVFLKVNTSPPNADFAVNKTFTCDGTVQFTDLSTNVPYSWYWDFGDGNFSIAENPTHTYTDNGTYDITLIATNAYGSDNITIPQLIEVDTTFKVRTPSCYPSTLSYCCDYGITRVQFSNINHPSSDAIEGYMDFSCEHQAFVEPNTNYALRIYTGSNNPQDTKAWIDYNDNGLFESNEKVMDKINTYDPVSIVQIPSNTVVNKALRLRISSDEVGSSFTSCSDLNRGQTEDYAIMIATCPEPVNVNIGQINQTNIQLTWDPGSSESSWNIMYGPQGFGVFSGTGILLNNIFTNNFYVTGLNELTCYDFYIQSNCAGTSSDWYGPFNACTVDIQEELKSSIKVIPNPNNGNFILKSTDYIENIEITNMIGQMILQENQLNTKTKNIDISMEQKGVYFVKVKLNSSKNTILKRVILH